MTDAGDSESAPRERGHRRQVRKRRRRQSEPQEATTDKPIDAVEQASQAEAVVVLGAEPESEPTAGSGNNLWDGVRRPLTAAFLIALVGGLTAEYFGSTLFALVAMVCYFAFGISRPKGSRNTEQFGDSLYYLGFILTLAALFLAMVPGFQGAELSSRNIIEKFGIAISTTFLGMALRIILLQLRQTASDQEEEAKESIARYVLKLNDEIKATIDAVRELRRAELENIKHAATNFDHHIDEVGATFRQTADRATAALKEAVGRGTTSLEQAANTLSQKLSAIPVPTDAISAAVSQGSADISQALSAVTNALKCITGEIANIEASVKAARENVARTADTASSMTEAHTQFADHILRMSEAMQRLNGEATKLTGLFSKLTEELNSRATEFDGELAKVRDELRAATEEARANSDAFVRTLVHSANVLRDAVREVGR